MLDSPNDHKCSGCKHFRNQCTLIDLNIDGSIKTTPLWFPSCHLYLSKPPLNLYVAIDRCKMFKEERGTK